MTHLKKRLVAAAALVLGGLLVVAPAASAASDPLPEGLTFWSGVFTGQTVTYPDVSDGCTVLPFVAHAELNDTATGIVVYESTDCTGRALTFPAGDVHSFTNFDARSFQVVD